MKIRYNKTDTRYWIRKVSFRSKDSRTYSVHIQHGNERRRIGLGTTDKEQAGALALEFYLKLRALGWEGVLRWWKRGDDSTSIKKSNANLGEYLNAVREKSLIHPPTLESYGAALRKIASDIHNVSDKKRSTRREQVDDIKLATLTNEIIETWRADFIKRGSTNPLKEKSAKVSANSTIGRARSLFSADVVARVKDVVELPDPIPFAGVKVERVRVTRYRSTFDMAALIESAQTELATNRTELFKILLLASMVGLRRHEIDLLPWTAFRWDEELIRIQATEHFRPKSHESESDIPIDPELLAMFRGYRARSEGEFVIESPSEPDANAPFGRYRCHRKFTELIGWLRAHGVTSRTPLHSLRKEYGSWVNQHFGLVAASEALRHSDIKTTFNHYIENKQRSVIGFSHLLAKSERVIIPMDDGAARYAP